MNTRILDFETNGLIYQSNMLNSTVDETNNWEQKHDLASDFYNYSREEISLEGVQISYNKIDALKKSEFILETNNDNILFVFCMAGNLTYRSLETNISSSLSKNEHSVFQCNFNHFVISFDGKAEYISIQFLKEHYSKLTGTDFSKKLSDFSSLNLYPEVNLILGDLFSKNINQKIRKIYLEAKIYDLLILFITKAEQNQTFSMKQDDVDKILKAKQIVESNIQSPNSLIELSRKVGINDYKLKKGFKEITGNTVFGYLYEIRMEHAFHLLSNEQKSVGEVAFLVGYKNAQHFTAAFKKKYNILPGILNKGKLAKSSMSYFSLTTKSDSTSVL